MKHIIEAFSILAVLVLNLCLCIGVLTVSADVAAAKEYKADVVAQIENSNFNPHVIEACRAQAAEQGYTLEVISEDYRGGGNKSAASVCLTYNYEIPLLGISKEQKTWGIAR